MTQSVPKWFEEPFRVLDLVFTPRLEDYPMEEVVRVCRRMHANVIHFHCQYNMKGGFNEHEMYFKSRLAKKTNRDVLGEFLPLAKKAGIRTVVYLNLHWYTRPFADEHPDWWVVKHDGARLEGLYGDDDASFCINSPWRDWSFTLLEDVCSYPVDGVFFDGPVAFLRREGCYCEHCQRLFRETYGREMPAPDRANRDDYALLREFTVTSMVRYYRDATHVVRTNREGAVVYGNYANVAEPDWAAGRSNRLLIPEMDALLAEGGFMYGRASKAIFKTGASSRLYETQAGSKPSINAVSMAFSPWRWVSLSAPETQVLLSEASVGVNPYYAIFVQGIDMPGVDAAADVYGFLKKNTKYYRKTVSGATVALLQSAQTLNTYGGVDIPWADLGYQKEQRAAEIGNYSRSFYGFYDMLIRSRVAFDIVDEQRLTEGDLGRYTALVLPNAACLSDSQCESLVSFVRAGGKLVADFETSHYDEHGQRRKDFGLAELFGVQSGNAVSDHRRWDYGFVTDPVAPHLGWMQTDYFPAPRRNLTVTPTAGTVQAVFSESVTSNIVASAQRTDNPLLVQNRLGEGICYYFPTMFGEFFEETQAQMYPRILAEIIGRDLPLAVSGAPNLIDVHLRLQPSRKRTMVHLVNLELGPIDEIIPARGLRLEVAVAHPVTSVTALRSGKSIRFRSNGTRVAFTLSELKEFEVLALEAITK